jgi:hypothetical protein
MPIIVVQLPADRTQKGTLSLVAADGATLLAGPFQTYGKADGQTAAANGNPTRNTLLPFGDTPLGTLLKAFFKVHFTEATCGLSPGNLT